MNRKKPDVVPSPAEILALITRKEIRKKVIWTAGRILKEAALWTRVEKLNYKERKAVLSCLTEYLDDLASRGILRRRAGKQSIGYGEEAGFEYIRSHEES
jgi:hypothetical protein